LGSFGEQLEQERTKRGVTLQDMADATKISSRMLRALETEEFDKLPGGIFNRGFVRAYARHLGIDPEIAVADFAAAEAGKHNGSGPALMLASTDPHPSRDTARFGAWVRLLVVLMLVTGAVWSAIHYRAPLRRVWQRLTHRQAQVTGTMHPAAEAAKR
jgi:cytoskeleton protein RodZ